MKSRLPISVDCDCSACAVETLQIVDSGAAAGLLSPNKWIDDDAMQFHFDETNDQI
jgi:hypothetical protein